MQENKEQWKVLAEQAATEQDPEKMIKLIKEIDDLLEQKERRLKGLPIQRVPSLVASRLLIMLAGGCAVEAAKGSYGHHRSEASRNLCQPQIAVRRLNDRPNATLVDQWLADETLAESISQDPTVDDRKVRRLYGLFCAPNRCTRLGVLLDYFGKDSPAIFAIGTEANALYATLCPLVIGPPAGPHRHNASWGETSRPCSPFAPYFIKNKRVKTHLPIF